MHQQLLHLAPGSKEHCIEGCHSGQRQAHALEQPQRAICFDDLVATASSA